MKRALIGVGLCVALAAPATASAVEKTFAGKVNGGGKIGIAAEVVDGHAVEVTHMRLKKVRANCTQSGGALVSAGYNFMNLLVNANGRFKIDEDTQSGEGHLFFKGEFKHRAKKVEGSLKAKLHFTVPPPEEDCNTGKRGYKADRGPLPGLPSGKALRLAP
jgi:hypothetical protein